MVIYFPDGGSAALNITKVKEKQLDSSLEASWYDIETSSWNQRSEIEKNNEIINLSSPKEGQWKVVIK